MLVNGDERLTHHQNESLEVKEDQKMNRNRNGEGKSSKSHWSKLKVKTSLWFARKLTVNKEFVEVR